MSRFVVAAMALIVSSGLAFAADGDRCKVTYPTGTPLNVRDGPNGKVISTLASGAVVAIVDYKDADNGKPWIKSSITRRKSRSAGFSVNSSPAL
jgi:hypothetical protein